MSRPPSSFRDVNVVSMRIEQEVAYVFPGTLASRPGPEELNWKTVGLRPAAARLQRFVEPPSQIISPFVIQDRLPFKCIRTSNALLRFVPKPFPNIKSYATDSVNVGGTSNFVMTENARLKENADSISASVVRPVPESVQYPFQLRSEFQCHQRVARWRLDPKILSRTNCYHPQIAPITQIQN